MRTGFRYLGFTLLIVMVFLVSSGVFAWDLKEAAKPYQGVSVKVMGWDRPETAALKKMVPKFEELTGIKVEIEATPWVESRNKMMLDFVAKGGEYDVVIIDLIWLGEFAEGGWIVPLDTFFNNPNLADPNLDLEDYFPLVLKACGQWGDKLYGFPANLYAHLLYYNKAMFKEAGFENPPESWEQLAEMAAKLTNAPKQYGYALQARRDEHMTCDGLLNFHWAFGGKILDENFKPVMNSPEGLNALNFMIGLKQYMPPGVADYGHDEAIMSLAQGVTAMVGEWAVYYSSLADPNQSIITQDLGVAMIPKVEKSGLRVPVLGGFGHGINATSPQNEQEAAYLFLQWAYGKEMAKEFMQGGGVSTRQSVYADQELMDSVPYFKPLVDSMPFVNPIHRPRFPEYPAMSEEMAINASRAFIGEITPEEALKNIDEKIFKILDEAGYYSGKKNLYQ